METKLLVFTENYQKGGGNKYLIDIVNALQSNFYKLTILSNNGGIDVDELKNINIDFQYHHVFFLTHALILNCNLLSNNKLTKFLSILDYFYLPFNVIIFIRKIYRYNPGLIYINNGGYPGGMGCLAMVIAANLCNKLAFLAILSVPSKRRKIIFFLEAILDWIVLRNGLNIIVNSNAIKNLLVVHRGATKDLIHVVQNFVPRLPHDAVIRRPRKTITVGCISRMDKQKGVIELVQAFLLLANEHKNINLLLIGDGEALNEIKLISKNSLFSNRIEITGYIAGEVHEYYDRIDIFVLPSIWEGLPYSILEAMRSGCAIIASNVGGIPDAVKHNVNGILIEPGSSETIYEAIKKMLNNPYLIEKYSAQNIIYFNKNFLREVIMNRINEIIDKIIKIR